MNALNRDIKKYEKIVVKAEVMKPEFKNIKYRIFIADSGFGMKADISGRKIFGQYEHDGERSFIYGGDVSVEETKALKNKSPKLFLSNVAGVKKMRTKKVCHVSAN